MITQERLIKITTKLRPYYEHLNPTQIYNAIINDKTISVLLEKMEPKDIVYFVFLLSSNENPKNIIKTVDVLEGISLLHIDEDSVNIPCGDCNGNYCGGDKEFQCPDCDGDGYFNDETECDYCYGTGKIECYECDGTGSETCDNCNGSYDFQEDCDKCENGIINPGEENEETCSKCEGTGELNCSKCDGTESQSCDACNGDGEIVCEKCLGNGNVDDDYAYGVHNYYILSYDSNLLAEIDIDDIKPMDIFPEELLDKFYKSKESLVINSYVDHILVKEELYKGDIALYKENDYLLKKISQPPKYSPKHTIGDFSLI